MPVITTGLTITSSYGSWYFGDLPLRADSTTVTQFCTDMGYGAPISYENDGGRFSNDGARLMNCFDLVLTGGTTEVYRWLNVYGYDGLVTSITT